MTPSEHDPAPDALDKAVSNRLAKLRTMPVDVSKLRRAVDARIGAPTGNSSSADGRRSLIFRIMTPMRAMAASLIVGGLVIALVIASASGPVLASPDRLAQIHTEMVSGDGGHGRQAVDSIAAAKAALASHDPSAPAIPNAEGKHVMACCVHMVGRKKMSCLMMEDNGVPISMAVADAADVKMPASETVIADGVTYHVQSAQGVNMVMWQMSGRWVCLMGKSPTGRLIEMAKGLRF